MAGEPIPCAVKTYTFRAQDVYVSCPRRIRFTLETYTFYSRYVCVRTREGTRSTDTSDEVREVGAGGAGEELGRGGGKKGSTVGRISDPQWVVDATYRGSVFAPLAEP